MPPNRSTRRRTFPDPRVRLPGDRRARPECGEALRVDRPGLAPRAAHAVAHLLARRAMAGLDRQQCPVARGVEAGPRRLPRARLHGVRSPSSSVATPRRAQWVDFVNDRAEAERGDAPDGLRRRGDSGALCARTRGLGCGGATRAASGARAVRLETLSGRRSGECLRARPRRGAQWQCRGGESGDRTAHRAARCDGSPEEGLLGRAGGHPDRHAHRLGRPSRRQKRRRAGADAGGSRPGGPDGKTHHDARPGHSGARDARRAAARPG